MENKEEKEISLDILKHLEDLSSLVNKLMASRTENILHRYPIAFGLLILLGVTALHEGLKGVMRDIGWLDTNPFYLVFGGLVILIITGTLYKKLDK